MAIPGSKPTLDVHGKVRIGVKKTSQGGKEYPSALDYFVSEEHDFAKLAGEKPKSIRIRLVHDSIEDAFNTGLEWWTKSRDAKRSTLACYTKDGGDNPVALRKEKMLDADDVKVGGTAGDDRVKIVCRARECPHFKKKGNKPADCRPMGRLIFVLDGDPLHRVWQIDTKAFNSIEALTGALQLAQTSGSLLGRLFDLSVQFVQKGGDRFPVLSIKELHDQDPQTGEAVAVGEAVIAVEQTEGDTRAKVIAALKASGRDPRSPAVAEWVKKVGLEEALKRLTEVAE